MANQEKSCEFCEHCLYICEGDFFCVEKQEIIASDFHIHDCKVCNKYTEVDE